MWHLGIIFFGFSHIIVAQLPEIYAEDEAVDMQIWLDYNPTFKINNEINIYGDVSARTIFPNIWYRFVARPSFRYNLVTFNEKTERYRSWEFHAGMGFICTHNYKQVNVLEIRPFQGIRIRIPNWRKGLK